MVSYMPIPSCNQFSGYCQSFLWIRIGDQQLQQKSPLFSFPGFKPMRYSPWVFTLGIPVYSTNKPLFFHEVLKLHMETTSQSVKPEVLMVLFTLFLEKQSGEFTLGIHQTGIPVYLTYTNPLAFTIITIFKTGEFNLQPHMVLFHPHGSDVVPFAIPRFWWCCLRWAKILRVGGS